jgi:hypothetical protein
MTFMMDSNTYLNAVPRSVGADNYLIWANWLKMLLMQDGI